MKFNTPHSAERQMREHPGATANYESGLSFSVDPRTELYLRAASCLVGENKFYESADFADQELIQATHLVLQTDPEFVLQLAVYLREEMYLRSVPLVLCAEYANAAPGTVKDARKYISRCIARADELTELLAYQFARNRAEPRRSKLPMAIKVGVAEAFPKFSRYALGKYNRKGMVTLKDAMRLTHPKPANDAQAADWKALGAGTLESPTTWETQRSQGLMTWHDVIHEVFNKDGQIMNYMAQLRNLRNIMQSDDVTDDDIALVCKMISDPDAVRNSKQLPFRFLSAYQIILKLDHPMVNSVLDALEDAIAISGENMPKLPGTTLIACDVSASMFDAISRRSVVQQFDIGLLLGSMAQQFCDRSITGIFGTTWKVMPMSKRSGILSNVMDMRYREGEAGYSTNGYKVIDYLIDEDIDVDRIMIFTDCQMWATRHDRNFAPTYLKYQRSHPSAKLYTFDLSGYGNIMIPQDAPNVCVIGGWSDRIFDFVNAFETDKDSAISRIKEITV